MLNDLSAGGASADLIKDTTTASFRQDVIAESMNRPVLVDFWAPWCGPCKQLTPVLEKVVQAAAGKIVLAKMNIDEHPSIAGQLGIEGRAITGADFLAGLIKTPFLGLAIGMIACSQGLATTGGAAGVGTRTTTAVVLSIFAVIVISSLFTLLYAVTGV